MDVAGTGFWFEGVELSGRRQILGRVGLDVFVDLLFEECEEDRFMPDMLVW